MRGIKRKWANVGRPSGATDNNSTTSGMFCNLYTCAQSYSVLPIYIMMSIAHACQIMHHGVAVTREVQQLVLPVTEGTILLLPPQLFRTRLVSALVVEEHAILPVEAVEKSPSASSAPEMQKSKLTITITITIIMMKVRRAQDSLLGCRIKLPSITMRTILKRMSRRKMTRNNNSFRRVQLSR